MTVRAAIRFGIVDSRLAIEDLIITHGSTYPGGRGFLKRLDAIRDENSDAFRTLKLIHALRDSGLASIPLREALSKAPFVSLSDGAPLEEIRERLAEAERANWRS